LGQFNPNIHLAQLQSLVKANNDLISSGGNAFYYFDGIIPPQISSPSAESPDFAEAKRYEAVFMPMLHGRLRSINYRPARFGTGRSLDGLKRICGGYYKEKLKPPA
jgi:hypothetical protein